MSSGNEKAIEYYKVLHGSVQNAHNLAWTITSIFVPIMFGSLTLLVVNSNDLSNFQYFIGSIILLCLPWFWTRIIKFLDNYNKVRLHLLKEAEAQLSAGSGDGNDIPFRYYTVLFDREERNKMVPRWISYMHLINTFAIVFVSLVIASLLYKLLMATLAGDGFAWILIAVTIVALAVFLYRIGEKRRRDTGAPFPM